jgi:hypothetical protein
MAGAGKRRFNRTEKLPCCRKASVAGAERAKPRSLPKRACSATDERRQSPSEASVCILASGLDIP